MPRISLKLHARVGVPDYLVEDPDLVHAVLILAEHLDLDLVPILQDLPSSLKMLASTHCHEVVAMNHYCHLRHRVAEEARVREALHESAVEQRLGVLAGPVLHPPTDWTPVIT